MKNCIKCMAAAMLFGIVIAVASFWLTSKLITNDLINAGIAGAVVVLSRIGLAAWDVYRLRRSQREGSIVTVHLFMG